MFLLLNCHFTTREELSVSRKVEESERGGGFDLELTKSKAMRKVLMGRKREKNRMAEKEVEREYPTRSPQKEKTREEYKKIQIFNYFILMMKQLLTKWKNLQNIIYFFFFFSIQPPILFLQFLLTFLVILERILSVNCPAPRTCMPLCFRDRGQRRFFFLAE